MTVSVATYKDNAPLAGALVKVSGSQIGAVTNDEGLAALQVPANSALEISHIGCKPHIAQVGDKARQMFMFDMQAETAGKSETEGTTVTTTVTDKPLYIVNGIETKEIGKLDPDPDREHECPQEQGRHRTLRRKGPQRRDSHHAQRSGYGTCYVRKQRQEG